MRILVCGGRDYARFPGHSAPPEELARYKIEKEHINRVLYDVCDEFNLWHEPDQYGNTLPKCTIISGGAKGADDTAIDWAVVSWTGLEVYPADWKKHGRGAGHIRNQQMLDEGKPDIVLAFPGGRGTENMIARAKKAGVEVRTYDRIVEPTSSPAGEPV